MRVLLLTGTCGSGKSTVARLIAATAGWSRVSEDEVWRRMYYRARGELGSPEHRAKRYAVRREVCALITAAVATGRDIVLDATVHEASPDSIGEYRELLDNQPVSVHVRVLHPRL